MDAEGYLKKHGWRGAGHSLDRSDRGIKKALQVSKKVDALGVGLQKYGSVSDQWWMRAYDQGLKDLGTGKQGDLDKIQEHGHNRGGLYARFVKGQPIPGTIDEYLATQSTRGADIERASTSVDQCNARKHSRKHAERDKVKRRKYLSQRMTENLTDVTKDGTDPRSKVQMFVNEAIRRGIIPAKDGKQVSNKVQSPSDADMAKVLALAGFDNRKHELKRQHMVRALKRAAMQHIDATRPP